MRALLAASFALVAVFPAHLRALMVVGPTSLARITQQHRTHAPQAIDHSVNDTHSDHPVNVTPSAVSSQETVPAAPSLPMSAPVPSKNVTLPAPVLQSGDEISCGQQDRMLRAGFLAFIMYTLAYVWLLQRRWSRLSGHTAGEALGEITELKIDIEEDNVSYYRVSYKFEVPSVDSGAVRKVYVNSRTIPFLAWTKMSQGDVKPVRYLTWDPRCCRLAATGLAVEKTSMFCSKQDLRQAGLVFASVAVASWVLLRAYADASLCPRTITTSVLAFFPFAIAWCACLRVMWFWQFKDVEISNS